MSSKNIACAVNVHFVTVELLVIRIVLMNDVSSQVKVCHIIPLHNPLTKVATKRRASI